MSQNIGSLLVDIGASTARLERDLNRAQRDLRSWGRNAVSIAKSAAGAIGIALGTGMFANAVKGAIDLNDQMAKLAQSTGVTVETLSSFRHAANLSGTSVENIAKSLGILSRNMQDVANGTGEARTALRRLNIDVVDSSGALRASDEVMGDIASRFAQMEDGAEKTALAMRLFGRSGAELIPMLNQGRGGIASMRQEAERLGLVIDTETAQAAEKFNDDLTRLKASAEGLGQAFLKTVLPAMASFAERLQSTFAPTVEQEIKKVEVLIAQLDDQLQGQSRFGDSIFARMYGNREEMEERRAFLQDTLSGLRDLRAATQPGDGDTFTLGETDEQLKAREQREADSFAMRLEMAESAERQRAAMQEEYGNARLVYLRRLAEEEDAADRLSFENRMARMDAENAQRERDEDARMTYLKRLRDESERQFDAMSQFGVQAARNIQDSFAQFLFDPFEDGIKGMADQFSRLLRQMMAQIAANRILTGLFSGMSGSANPILAGIGSGFGGARATGGPVSGGKTYLVGERGPELLTMGGSGHVTPNNQLGGQTNVTIINRTDAQPRVTKTQNAQGGMDVVVMLEKAITARMGRGSDMTRTLEAIYPQLRRV